VSSDVTVRVFFLQNLLGFNLALRFASDAQWTEFARLHGKSGLHGIRCPFCYAMPVCVRFFLHTSIEDRLGPLLSHVPVRPHGSGPVCSGLEAVAQQPCAIARQNSWCYPKRSC
jgi:hypothetical protein